MQVNSIKINKTSKPSEIRRNQRKIICLVRIIINGKCPRVRMNYCIARNSVNSIQKQYARQTKRT